VSLLLRFYVSHVLCSAGFVKVLCFAGFVMVGFMFRGLCSDLMFRGFCVCVDFFFLRLY